MYTAARYRNDRVTALRVAIFDIALRDGARGINVPTVAAELGIAVNTLRRWVSTADRLPIHGIKHVEYRRRCRLMQPVPCRINGDEPWHRALDGILRDLPFDQSSLDEHRVWRAIIDGFVPAPWAVSYRDDAAARERALIRMIVEGLSPPDVPFEEQRLQLLVEGARGAAMSNLIAPEETARLVSRHVEEVRSASHRGPSSNAA